MNEAKKRDSGNEGVSHNPNGSRFDQRFNFEKTHQESRKISDDINIQAYYERKKAREAERERQHRDRNDYLEK